MLSSTSRSTAAASQEEGERGRREGCPQLCLPTLSPLSGALFSAERGVWKAIGCGDNYRRRLPRGQRESVQIPARCYSPVHGVPVGQAVVFTVVRSPLSCRHYRTCSRMGLWSDNKEEAWLIPPTTPWHAGIPLSQRNLGPSLAHAPVQESALSEGQQ